MHYYERKKCTELHDHEADCWMLNSNSHSMQTKYKFTFA